MGRRREYSEFDVLRELLQTTPAWFGPLLAAVVYCLLRFVPAMLMPAPKAGDIGYVFRMMMPTIALVVAMMIMAVWLSAELWKFQNRRLLDRQTGTDSIRQISWQEFERLVSEAFRRRGYVAEVVGRSSGDGGIDIRLTRGGQTTIVQCKHWRAWKVGVAAIRELLGVVVSQRATRGILVTSGRFTQEAIAFADANPTIELINGETLAQMIREVQTARAAAPMAIAAPPPAITPPQTTPSLNPEPRTLNPPNCPTCGSTMVRRAARKGPNAGSDFWGCRRYPDCRGIRQMN